MATTTTDRPFSTPQWAALVALLLSSRGQLISSASTFHQRPHHHQSSNSNYQLAWQDNSSTDNNNYHRQYYRNNQNSNDIFSSQSPLYFSEDEYEERILSALARLSSDESDNDDYYDNDDEGNTLTEGSATTDHNSRRYSLPTQQGDYSISSLSNDEDSSLSDGYAAILQRSKERKSRSRRTKTRNIQPEPSATTKTTTTTTIPKENDTREAQPTTKSIQNSVPLQENTELSTLQNKDEPTIRRPTTYGQSSQNSATTPLAASSTPTHPYGGPYEYSRPYISSNTLASSNKVSLHSEPVASSSSLFTSSQQQQQQRQQSSQFMPQSTRVYSPAAESSKTRSNPKNSAPTKQQQATATKDNNNSITPWIKQFISSRPKDALLPVPRDYLLDNFNLVRLAPVVEKLAASVQQQQVSPINLEEESISKETSTTTTTTSQQQHPYAIYRAALDLILRQEESADAEEPSFTVQYAAEVLYCLVHARFVVSPRGLDTIRRRLVLHGSSNSKNPLFGRCPKLQCGGMPLLPCGLADDYHCLTAGDRNSVSSSSSRAKRYCCNCHETIHCWESKVDQSAWGTSVCHLLLMVYGKEELFPSHFMAPYSSTISDDEHPATTEISQNCGHIFGFPVHPSVHKTSAALE